MAGEDYIEIDERSWEIWECTTSLLTTRKVGWMCIHAQYSIITVVKRNRVYIEFKMLALVS